MDLKLRFMRKVDQRGGEDACWPWLGKRDRCGYGRVSMTPKNSVQAHRVAYTLFVSDIQPGNKVLHRCDNPPCCNPNHLFQGTQADNVKDMIEKGRSSFGRPGATPSRPLPTGRVKDTRGEGNGMAKLTSPQVAEIRSLKAAGETAKEIARRFGITPTNVRVIARGDGWRHV